MKTEPAAGAGRLKGERFRPMPAGNGAASTMHDPVWQWTTRAAVWAGEVSRASVYTSSILSDHRLGPQCRPGLPETEHFSSWRWNGSRSWELWGVSALGKSEELQNEVISSTFGYKCAGRVGWLPQPSLRAKLLCIRAGSTAEGRGGKFRGGSVRCP